MSAKAVGRVWDLDIPHNKRLVLLAMADHADHEGRNMFPSTDLIAWKTGYSFRQVQRIIDELLADGILVEMKPARQQRPATYALNFSAAKLKPPFDRVARKKQSRQNGTPEGRQNGTPEKSRDDILSHPGMTFQPSRDDIAMSSEPWEPSMNHDGDLYTNPSPTPTAPPQKNGVGGGDGYEKEARRVLSAAGFTAARKIAALYAAMGERPPIEHIKTSIENTLDPNDPKSLNKIALRLQDDPPVAAPYPKPTKALGSGGPSNGHVPVPKNALQGEALREAALKLRKPKT